VARVRSLAVVGEAGGSLFLAAELRPETLIVAEGRALLVDGDEVDAKESSIR